MDIVGVWSVKCPMTNRYNFDWVNVGLIPITSVYKLPETACNIVKLPYSSVSFHTVSSKSFLDFPAFIAEDTLVISFSKTTLPYLLATLSAIIFLFALTLKSCSTSFS